jgi:hypothetical protein
MGEEVPIANPLLSAEERAAVEKLTDADLQIVDTAILTNCSTGWFKVARIVVDAEQALAKRYPALSYLFYTERLRWLVHEGRLESQGDLQYIRFSEVRLPTA